MLNNFKSVKGKLRRAVQIKLNPPMRLDGMDQSSLENLERLIQHQLGKGSGAFSTTEEVLAIKSLWPQSKAAPKVIFDVGAHHGDWTDAALRVWPSATFYLFEPAHELYALLKQKYHNYSNVSVFNLAISNTSADDVRLFGDIPNSGLASLTKRRLDHFNLGFDFSELVNVRTLKDLMHEVGVESINILKIDVEGEEHNVLLGLEDDLTHIELIQFEFGGCNIDTRTFFQDFWYLLTKYGFSFYRIAPKGVFKQDSYNENLETFTTTNYLATNF
jgi:FkbM family methyltransferase